jgi:hypothetical protein
VGIGVVVIAVDVGVAVGVVGFGVASAALELAATTDPASRFALLTWAELVAKPVTITGSATSVAIAACETQRRCTTRR